MGRYPEPSAEPSAKTQWAVPSPAPDLHPPDKPGPWPWQERGHRPPRPQPPGALTACLSAGCTYTGRTFHNNQTFPSMLDPCLSCICLVRPCPPRNSPAAPTPHPGGRGRRPQEQGHFWALVPGAPCPARHPGPGAGSTALMKASALATRAQGSPGEAWGLQPFSAHTLRSVRATPALSPMPPLPSARATPALSPCRQELSPRENPRGWAPPLHL